MTKYKAKKTVVDGITFDSMKEAKRYGVLKMMEKSGVIRNLELQPSFDCYVNQVKVCTYKADFKGFKTAVYKLKKKLVEACHIGVKIEEV